MFWCATTSCKPITDKLCHIFWVGIGEKFGSLPSNLKMEAVCSHDKNSGAAEAIHMLYKGPMSVVLMCSRLLQAHY
jgi:hypothetical protein